tara:strand:- start:1148 stop:1543 length:396 start_codon:yes stop_codon:yes gene_type:complete
MEYRNAKYVTETSIECEINHLTLGWIPYGIADHETDPYAITLNAILKSSMEINNDVKAYSAPSDEVLSLNIRAQRDSILGTIVDPVVSNPLRWADMSSEKQEEWRVYRQNLLNIPESSSFPSDVTWPTPPE